MRISTLVHAAAFALTCVIAQPLLAAVGTLDAFEGDVRVVSSKYDRAAQTAMELNEGDTVKTGANAWALLAMSDGASFTLRPNSHLRLDTYRYDPEGESGKNSSVLSLLKGAFRSVTGYIGRTNREGYRVATPTATIGIRGTDHEPAYYPPPGAGEKLDHDPGTYDKVNEGESFIKNPQGEVAIKRGQTAFVDYHARVAPRLLARPPAFYHRHAAFDKRAAVRRQEFHRKFEEQHQRRVQERREKFGPHKGALNENKKSELQHQRRELIEKRQREREDELAKRQALQEQKKQERAEELKKRQQELARKKELKKEHEEEKKEHGKKH